MESLDALDQVQTEKVMAYIKGLVTLSRDDVGYQKLKRQALKEIRQALGNGPILNPSL
jgi:hypothetical protein